MRRRRRVILLLRYHKECITHETRPAGGFGPLRTSVCVYLFRLVKTRVLLCPPRDYAAAVVSFHAHAHIHVILLCADGERERERLLVCKGEGEKELSSGKVIRSCATAIPKYDYRCNIYIRMRSETIRSPEPPEV
jgi:hypothetical protein